MLFQNTKSDNEENFIRSEESDETSIDCSFSIVMKFDDGVSVNGYLNQLYCWISSEKYFPNCF